MPATADERAMLRMEFDIDSSTLTDDGIDLLFSWAEAQYAAYNRTVQTYAAYWKLAIQLRNSAAKRVDVRQNESDEKLSQLFTNLNRLASAYKQLLDQEIADAQGGVALRFAKGRVVPSRLKDYPDA